MGRLDRHRSNLPGKRPIPLLRYNKKLSIGPNNAGNLQTQIAVRSRDEMGGLPENTVLHPLYRVQFSIHAKGKMERGVAYVRANALKGRRFKSLAEENLFLSHWEGSVADKRIHGTTRKQVAACFEEERLHLQPLPPSLFPCFQEGRRSVHRDSYVEVEKAFYEAPPELIGREVWVRWDSRCVKIFNERMEQVGMHTRQEPGKFSHSLGAGGFSAPVLSSCRYWVNRAAVLGEQCGQWAQSALDARGPESLRSIMGLCDLIKKHSGAVLNAACAKALKAGTHRLKDLRRLIGEQSEQTAFGFAESHPLIRDLKTYSDFIHHHQQYQNDD